MGCMLLPHEELQSGGAVDAGAEYQKDLNEDVSKLQRLYGGGNLEKFPDLKFEEPKLEDVQK
ncbi:unnamed protein product [Ranitomeya imitator]|uniref:ATP synthase peripheral stalk subunit F6, mitochondrial n=1 Tax=Ranitomeya imitator TaxID=111125 RepID=A0ABN9M7L4_9NEOB|nr:unnamed protein product [Ranitomeya imitator]